MQISTGNAKRCNNRDDLLHLNYTLKNFNIFGGLYITQSKIYDGAFTNMVSS